jgi:hypothetical protein
MNIRRVLNTLVLLPLAWPLVAGADARDYRFVVSPEQVTRAMRASGVPVSVEQIELLSSVRSRQAEPSLRVVTVRQWQGNTRKAELRCTNGAACLPFYVLVRNSDAEAQNSPRAQSNSAEIRAHDVHVGDPAVLIFERDQSRITIRVVCVQAGDRGQKIRVASRDRKKFYEGEVLQSGLLRGTL